MNLETVKVISRNDAIRGKEFDVYFSGEGRDINICSIEDVTGTTDLKDLLSDQSMADIKFSLNEVLSMRSLRNLMGSFSPSQINTGYVSEAIKNNERGYTND